MLADRVQGWWQEAHEQGIERGRKEMLVQQAAMEVRAQRDRGVVAPARWRVRPGTVGRGGQGAHRMCRDAEFLARAREGGGAVRLELVLRQHVGSETLVQGQKCMAHALHLTLKASDSLAETGLAFAEVGGLTPKVRMYPERQKRQLRFTHWKLSLTFFFTCGWQLGWRHQPAAAWKDVAPARRTGRGLVPGHFSKWLKKYCETT